MAHYIPNLPQSKARSECTEPGAYRKPLDKLMWSISRRDRRRNVIEESVVLVIVENENCLCPNVWIGGAMIF
jgi:hypothetical protein